MELDNRLLARENEYVHDDFKHLEDKCGELEAERVDWE